MHRGGPATAWFQHPSFSRWHRSLYWQWLFLCIFFGSCVGLCVIMTMSLQRFIWVYYFCFLLQIMKVVSRPFTLVVCPSDLSLNGVLVRLELFLYGVSSSPSTIKSWPSIDWEIPSIVGVLQNEFSHARFSIYQGIYQLLCLKHMSFTLNVVRLY